MFFRKFLMNEKEFGKNNGVFDLYFFEILKKAWGGKVCSPKIQIIKKPKKRLHAQFGGGGVLGALFLGKKCQKR